MTLIFFLEARYIKNAEGEIYNPEGVLKFPLWDRYLESFTEIVVVARVKYDPNYIGQVSKRADGLKVSFFELPYFTGPKEYLLNYRLLNKRILEATELNGSFLLRVPGSLGFIASKILNKKGIPYGVEVVGDPYDVFSKGAVKHPLRVFFKYKYYLSLKRTVKQSSVALFVTKEILQKRYPVLVQTPKFSASNVSLLREHVVQKPKLYNGEDTYQLVSIGSLEQMYKAPDILIKVISELVKAGFNVGLTWIGSGKYLNEMKVLAKELKVEERISFVGYVSDREEINQYLDDSHCFVLASRTEGLPRVAIEAMARGLPIVGTKVGGIPELVITDLLVDKDNVDQIKQQIIKLIDNPHFASKVSLLNLEKALSYTEDQLTIERKKFYKKLINLTTKL